MSICFRTISTLAWGLNDIIENWIDQHFIQEETCYAITVKFEDQSSFESILFLPLSKLQDSQPGMEKIVWSSTHQQWREKVLRHRCKAIRKLYPPHYLPTQCNAETHEKLQVLGFKIVQWWWGILMQSSSY